MGKHDRMDVADWQDLPKPILPTNRVSRHLSPMLLGAFGTLLLHALLIQSLNFGIRGLTARPASLQPSVGNGSANGEAQNLVLLTLASSKSGEENLQNIVSSVPTINPVHSPHRCFPIRRHRLILTL